MALTATRSLSKAVQQQLLRPFAARGFAAGDKLESDARTTKPQQRAHDTDVDIAAAGDDAVGQGGSPPPAAGGFADNDLGCVAVARHI